MKDKELEEQTSDQLAQQLIDELKSEGMVIVEREEMIDLIAQERRKAKIEVLEWVYCNLPKRGDRFRNAKKTDLQEIIMGLDMDIAWEIAELKEDKE